MRNFLYFLTFAALCVAALTCAIILLFSLPYKSMWPGLLIALLVLLAWIRIRNKRQRKDALSIAVNAFAALSVLLAFLSFFWKESTDSVSAGDILLVFAVICAVPVPILLIIRTVRDLQDRAASRRIQKKYAPYKTESEAPHHIGFAECIYSYDNVPIDPAGKVLEEWIACRVDFISYNNAAMISIADELVGTIDESSHTVSMVQQWLSRGDPIYGIVDYVNKKTNELTVAIFFYRDEFKRFIERNPDAPAFPYIPASGAHKPKYGEELVLSRYEFEDKDDKRLHVFDCNGIDCGIIAADQIKGIEKLHSEIEGFNETLERMLEEETVSFYYGGNRINEDGAPVPYLYARFH